MRLRNAFVLGAFVAMSLGSMACSKKTEEQKPADSMMTPAPAAPAPAPAPAPTPAPDTAKKPEMKAPETKGGEMKKEEKKEMKKKYVYFFHLLKAPDFPGLFY